MTDAAIWLRVSTKGQDTDNQVPDLDRFTSHHGLTVVRRYVVSDSAWRDGGGREYRDTLNGALREAHEGVYSVMAVWALDRIVRLGAEDALRIIRQFRERGAALTSVKEPWLSGSAEVTDVLVAFAGWMAERESARRSERIKAGLAKRAADGKPVGRQPGAKDREPRKRSGYVARWDRERSESRSQGAVALRAIQMHGTIHVTESD